MDIFCAISISLFRSLYLCLCRYIPSQPNQNSTELNWKSSDDAKEVWELARMSIRVRLFIWCEWRGAQSGAFIVLVLSSNSHLIHMLTRAEKQSEYFHSSSNNIEAMENCWKLFESRNFEFSSRNYVCLGGFTVLTKQKSS